jgi:hypothetical protein
MRICAVASCNIPVFGTDKITRIGYCKSHLHLRTDTDKRSPYEKAMDKKDKFRDRSIHRKNTLSQEVVDELHEKKKLQQWFIDRRLEMTGVCACGCGKSTSRNDNENYKSSLAHVLAKKLFHSIATHPANCIELNFWDGCHTTFDNMGYEHCYRTKPVLWAIVVRKFKILYPHIAPSERKHIPDILLQFI